MSYLDEIFETVNSRFQKKDILPVFKRIASFHRIQGTKEFNSAQEYIHRELSENKIASKIIDFPMTPGRSTLGFPHYQGYRVKNGVLTVLDSTRTVLADYETNPFSIVQRAGSVNGRYELVLDSDENTRGKFVLTDNLSRAIYKHIYGMESAGIVYYNKKINRNARQYKSFWYFDKHERKIPGFVINRIKADYLKKLLASEKVFIHADITSSFYETSLKVVEANIQGKRKDSILITAHSCHPRGSANDNTSGAASLLYSAIVLKSLITQGKLPVPEYSIKFLFIPEMWGTAFYIDLIMNSRKKLPVAGLNYDMVGSNLKKTAGFVTVELPPYCTDDINTPLFLHILNYVHKKMQLPLKTFTRPFDGGSDHLILNDPMVNIPAPMLIHWPCKYYHTDMDTVSNIDMHMMQRNILSIILFIYARGSITRKQLMYLAFQQALANYNPFDKKSSPMMFLKLTKLCELFHIDREILDYFPFARQAEVNSHKGTTYVRNKMGISHPALQIGIKERLNFYRIKDIYEKEDEYTNFAEFLFCINGKRSTEDIYSILEMEHGKSINRNLLNFALNMWKRQGIISEKTV